MKQVNFYLTEQQIAKLKKLSELDGLSVSEHIRRAIDEYADRKTLDKAVYEEAGIE